MAQLILVFEDITIDGVQSVVLKTKCVATKEELDGPAPMSCFFGLAVHNALRDTDVMDEIIDMVGEVYPEVKGTALCPLVFDHEEPERIVA